jgi:hypothetical protein
MKRLETVAMLAVLAPIALACGLLAAQQVERFEIVSGRGYEGAIIPAPLVPDWYKEAGVTSTWTPTGSDVALTEARMVSYLELGAKDLSLVSPRPGVVYIDELRGLVGRLPSYKRQYIGLAYGDRRRILVNGIPDMPRFKWREQVVMVVDGGCGFWHVDFDMQDKHVVRFWCQGSP